VQTGPMQMQEKLDRSSIVFGVDCERCHGPARQHAEYQESHPQVKEAKYIVSIKSLPRARRMDLCSMCHSGNDQATQRTLFAFVPGDTLSHFLEPDFGGVQHPDPDVHGKQAQLLMASACYQKSGLTCMTCHDAHRAGEEKMTAFVSKCMDCHAGSTHANAMVKDPRCIDCHMPLQTSKAIYFNNGSESKNIPYLIRTHKIAIYQ
ncbi:MAG TPA: cytochrome c3 family protein, partial [Puia sp.]